MWTFIYSGCRKVLHPFLMYKGTAEFEPDLQILIEKIFFYRLMKMDNLKNGDLTPIESLDG